MANRRRRDAPTFAGRSIAVSIGRAGHNCHCIAACSACGAPIQLSLDDDNALVYLSHRGELCASWDREGELRVAKVLP